MYTIIQVFKITFPGEIAGPFPVNVSRIGRDRLGLLEYSAGRLIDVPTDQ